jgi:hypothetical protein
MNKEAKIKKASVGEFSKSLRFLYPLLGIHSEHFKPLKVYVGVQDWIDPKERCLVCVFDTSKADFTYFETAQLFFHEAFREVRTINAYKSIYLFNFPYPHLWDYFLKGKYSRFGLKYKSYILRTCIKEKWHVENMRSFLFPSEYFERYAHLLNVPVELLHEVGELCSHPDMNQENMPPLNQVSKP